METIFIQLGSMNEREFKNEVLVILEHFSFVWFFLWGYWNVFPEKLLLLNCFKWAISRKKNIYCNKIISMIYFLNHYGPMFYFYTQWKYQKTFGFLTFSRGIEMKHWAKMG